VDDLGGVAQIFREYQGARSGASSRILSTGRAIQISKKWIHP
jgi:hypothetical protein